MCVYIKGQSGFIHCLHSLFISHFKTNALMLEVSKVSKVLRYIACVKNWSKVMYVEGIKRRLKYTLRAVMLCMSKV